VLPFRLGGRSGFPPGSRLSRFATSAAAVASRRAALYACICTEISATSACVWCLPWLFSTINTNCWMRGPPPPSAFKIARTERPDASTRRAGDDEAGLSCRGGVEGVERARDRARAPLKEDGGLLGRRRGGSTPTVDLEDFDDDAVPAPLAVYWEMSTESSESLADPRMTTAVFCVTPFIKCRYSPILKCSTICFLLMGHALVLSS